MLVQVSSCGSVIPLLVIRDVVKMYDGFPALRGVSLCVPVGSITAVLGPSGCGKTTLLRVIAGLDLPDSGSLWCGDQVLDRVPVHQRDFGLMFQEYALFPHRDVAANVAFGLRMRKVPRAQVAARVAELLMLVGLVGYERRRVDGLSGGERQRVALARSLAPHPRLLMLDEPLGALDRVLRERLLDEMRVILRRVGVTSLYVTHDQAEAFAIADRVVLMDGGRVEQVGSPEEVYRQPASLFVARFLGLRNVVRGQVLDVGAELLIATEVGRLRVLGGVAGVQRGAWVTLVLRPEAARVVVSDVSGEENVVCGCVVGRSFRGSRTQVSFAHVCGVVLLFEVDDVGLPAVGESVTVVLRPDGISVIGGVPAV